MLKKIEDYQLKELQDNKLYINEYDLSLKYNYELNTYWKELFFDILEQLTLNDYEFHLDYLTKTSLFSYMKKNYKNIIKMFNLSLDERDYIEITDYVSYQEWLKNPDNGIAYFGDGIYLVKKDINNEI